MMVVSNKTKVVLVISGMTFILSSIILGCSWYYIDYLQTQLHETRINTKRIQDEKQQLSALEKLAFETKEERAKLASYIIPDQGVIVFLSLLESTARTQGVSPTTHTIATQLLTGEKGFEELVVNMSLTGALEDIEKVIHLYESMPYQIRIEHVTLHVEGKNESSATADMTIVATKMTP